MDAEDTQSETNKHGLDRYIPADVARAVRQRCGFGCVICGLALVDYDHMVTPFADAKVHDPADITLLCAFHHAEKTRHRLSLETILRHNADPWCRKAGSSQPHGPFDIGTGFQEVAVGTMRFLHVKTIIEISGERVLYIDPPEEPGGPFRLNALITDKDGRPILRIVENEWRTPSDMWDVQVQGPRITIRRAAGDIAVQMRIDPPNSITFERLQMAHRGIEIEGRAGQHVNISRPGQPPTVSAEDVTFEDCEVGIEVQPTSVALGKGGRMFIGSMTLGGHHAPPRVNPKAVPPGASRNATPDMTRHPYLSREEFDKIWRRMQNKP